MSQETKVPPKEKPKVNRFKESTLVWLALYPSLNLFVWLTTPYISDWPQLAQTFLSTIVLVPLLVYWLVPILFKIFKGWE